MSTILSSSSKTIDIPIQQLFNQFDLNTDKILTRKQLSIFLNNIFIKMNINKSVTQEDINNFLVDYSINHNRNQLTQNDFQGIKMLRFVVNTKLVQNKEYINNMRNTNYNINQIQQGSQLRQIQQGSQISQISQIKPNIITKVQQIQAQPQTIPIQAHFIKSIKQVQSMNNIQLNKTINITRQQQTIKPKPIFQPSIIKYTIPSSKFSTSLSSSQPITRKITIPISMLFDCFNPSHSGSLSLTQIQKVLTLIFQDFGLIYSPSTNDVMNFLKDFDINKDKEINIHDFNGKNVLVFQFYQNKNTANQMKLVNNQNNNNNLY